MAASSSNVDVLRLEYPRTADEVAKATDPAGQSLEISDPRQWVVLLVQRQQQAQRDLEILYEACGKEVDRNDARLVQIEADYITPGVLMMYGG